MMDIANAMKVQGRRYTDVLNYTEKVFQVNKWEWKRVVPSSFNTSLIKIEKKVKSLHRGQQEEDKLNRYLSEPYRLPVLTKNKENESGTSEPLPDSSHQKAPACQFGCEILKNVNRDLAKEVNKLQVDLEQKESEAFTLKKESDGLSVQLSKMKERKHRLEPKRLNQALKRKMKQLQDKDREIKRLKIENYVAKRKLDRNVQNRRRQGQIRQPSITFKTVELVKQLRQQLAAVELDKTVLEDKLRDMADNLIITKQDGKTYTSAVRRVVYDLICAQVSVDNIPVIIQSVVTNLTKKTVGPLPDPTTCSRIAREMKELSKYQINEELSSAKNTTVKYDGTSKKKTHYVEVQVATTKKTLTTGLSLMASGTAEAYTNSVMQSLQDIGAAGMVITGRDTTAQILGEITNTMTDRHIVNKKANELLYMEKSRKGETASTPWNNFYCSVHPLDTLAKSADASVKTVEQDLVDGEVDIGIPHVFQHRQDSHTQSLIQAVCKIFYKDGVGCPAEISAFLHERGFKSVPVFPFLGNRFNILFVNAAGVFCTKDLLLYFLEKVWGTPNELFRAVLNDLRQQGYITCCRALGLVSKYVTGPWQRLAESGLNILEMNKYYEDGLHNLEQWATDPTPIIRGQAQAIFGGVDIKQDDVYRALIAPSDTDEDTKIVLQKIFMGFKDVYLRQLADQLPGGEHFHPSPDLIQQAASCESTNISGERIFGQLDFQLKRAPNLKVDFAESKIMYSANETAVWLDEKSSSEHDSLISAARKSARQSMMVSHSRYSAVLSEKSSLLKQKQEEKAKKEEKQRENKENILVEINQYGGLWSSEERMKTELEKQPNDHHRIMAVKNQLRVRKIILQQKANKDLLAFSCNKKAYSLVQLKENLVKLMKSGSHDNDTSEMSKVLKEPKLLEFKYIRHLWEPNPGQEKWYDGYIHHMVFSDDGILEYKVEYFNPSEEAILSYDELVTDLRAGELVILWDKGQK